MVQERENFQISKNKRLAVESGPSRADEHESCTVVLSHDSTTGAKNK